MDNIVITGISGGIGHAVAERLLEEGASIIGIARETNQAVRELTDKYGSHIHIEKFDLMRVEEIHVLLKKLVDQYGPLGGFVHCAGFDKMAPLHLVKLEDMEALWRIHALVPMHMIGLMSKKKNHRENMSIVLISSQAAHEGAMGHTAYASAKGAIEGFLAPAAAELMEKGIRINEVCLAPVYTNMSAGWMSKLSAVQREKLENAYPMGIGSAGNAADIVCFLLSDHSLYINGQIIIADGGHSVRKV